MNRMQQYSTVAAILPSPDGRFVPCPSVMTEEELIRFLIYILSPCFQAGFAGFSARKTNMRDCPENRLHRPYIYESGRFSFPELGGRFPVGMGVYKKNAFFGSE